MGYVPYKKYSLELEDSEGGLNTQPVMWREVTQIPKAVVKETGETT